MLSAIRVFVESEYLAQHSISSRSTQMCRSAHETTAFHSLLPAPGVPENAKKSPNKKHTRKLMFPYLFLGHGCTSPGTLWHQLVSNARMCRDVHITESSLLLSPLLLLLSNCSWDIGWGMQRETENQANSCHPSLQDASAYFPFPTADFRSLIPGPLCWGSLKGQEQLLTGERRQKQSLHTVVALDAIQYCTSVPRTQDKGGSHSLSKWVSSFSSRFLSQSYMLFGILSTSW